MNKCDLCVGEVYIISCDTREVITTVTGCFDKKAKRIYINCKVNENIKNITLSYIILK